MKKKKGRFAGALVEALLEILLTLVCFGVGAAILSAFGVDLENAGTDFELVLLLGLGIVFLLVLLVFFIIRWIRRMRG